VILIFLFTGSLKLTAYS